MIRSPATTLTPLEYEQAADEYLRSFIDQAAKINQQSEQIAQLLNLLRRQIELRATQVGRHDILKQLATTADVAQLELWLQELG